MKLQQNQIVRNVKQLQKPSGASSLSYAEVFKNHETSPPISFPKCSVEEKKRIECWKKMSNAVKDKVSEDDIQTEFLKMLREMKFKNLEFYDTHTNNNIAHPQKPDITGIVSGIALHTKSTVVLFELRASHRSVDGKMKGQLISAVNRVWDIAHQEIYGFALNGHEQSTFVYHKSEKGPEVGHDTYFESVLKLLEEWDKEIGERSSGFKPIVSGYTINYRLGSGKTSDVYCVSENRSNDILVLKVPKEDSNSQEVVCHEVEMMLDLNNKKYFFDNDHLAKIDQTVDVTVGDSCRVGFLSYPCGLDKKDGKLSLVSKDAIDLVKALQDLHNAGYFHRDVSPCNIGHYENEEGSRVVFLRDFGFAVTCAEAENQVYQGTMVTASKSVLESLKNSEEKPFAFTARDDFESLVKTLLIGINGHSPLIPEEASSAMQKAQAMLTYWENRDKDIQAFVDSLLQANFETSCRILLPSGEIPFFL